MNEAHSCCINGDGRGWFLRLNAIYKEIAPFLKDKEFEEAEKMREELHNKNNNYSNEEKGEIDGEFYIALDKFEMYIRKKMKECKMILPLEDNMDVWR